MVVRLVATLVAILLATIPGSAQTLRIYQIDVVRAGLMETVDLSSLGLVPPFELK